MRFSIRLLLAVLFLCPALPVSAEEYECKILHVYKWSDGELTPITSSNLINQLLPLTFNDKTSMLDDTKYKIIRPLKGHGEMIAESADKLETFRLRVQENDQPLNFLKFDGMGLYTGSCKSIEQ